MKLMSSCILTLGIFSANIFAELGYISSNASCTAKQDIKVSPGTCASYSQLKESAQNLCLKYGMQLVKLVPSSVCPSLNNLVYSEPLYQLAYGSCSVSRAVSYYSSQICISDESHLSIEKKACLNLSYNSGLNFNLDSDSFSVRSLCALPDIITIKN